MRRLDRVFSSGLRTPAALLILVSATSLMSDDTSVPTYQLRYQFHPGSSVDYKVDNNSEIEVEQAGAEQHVVHSEISHKHYRVTSVDEEGNGVLELTIDRVQMSASVDGDEPVTYDSSRDRQPPAQFIGIADTIGRPHARITISPTGQLLAIEWLLQQQHENLPTKEDDGKLDILVHLPENPVAIGGEWKQRFETDVRLKDGLQKSVTMLRTYRLSSVVGNKALIELKTAVITPLRDPELEAQLIQKTPSGTVEFDLDRGVLISRSTSLDREVVGFNGGNSRIRNKTTRSEQLVEQNAQATKSQLIQTAEEPGPQTR